MCKKALFILYLFSTFICYGKEPQDSLVNSLNTPTPTIYKLQFAGGMGLLSAGAGYSFFKNKYQSSLLLGFTPTLFSRKNIVTLGLRNTIIPMDIAIGKKYKLSPYAGLTISFSGFLPLPLLPHLGIRFYKPLSKKIISYDLYIETTSTQRELFYFCRNKTIAWYSILNTALGITLYLK